MSSLFDDVARILATPMPRRKALARIAGILGGALLASVPVKAVGNCGACTVNNDCTGGDSTCKACPGGGRICCKPELTCCGTMHCCAAGCCNPQTGNCFTSAGCTGQC
jgi:hypothetical protein